MISLAPLSLAARFAPYRLAAELAGVVLALLGMAGAAYFAYQEGQAHKFAELSADWEAQQRRQVEYYVARLKARGDEVEEIRWAEREKDLAYEAKMRHVAAQRDTAIGSLRDRAERASAGDGVPTPCAASASQAGATGAQLSRPDAEFLVGEAARADELRAALNRCQGGDLVVEGGRGDR